MKNPKIEKMTILEISLKNMQGQNVGLQALIDYAEVGETTIQLLKSMIDCNIRCASLLKKQDTLEKIEAIEAINDLQLN